jgi:transposase InsO family protein
MLLHYLIHIVVCLLRIHCDHSLHAKHVCDPLLQLFMQTDIASGLTISSDNGTNCAAKLTAEFMKSRSCSPRFSSPGHPQACGLVERYVGTIKNMVSKLASDHAKQWWRYLPYVLWALREVPNETTSQATNTLVHGRFAKGPLAILKETWAGECEIPLTLGKE